MLCLVSIEIVKIVNRKKSNNFCYIGSFFVVYLQELCSSLIFHLDKIGASSEAFSVYNMLRYSKRTMHKALHEKILHILIKGRLFKHAYVVIKVCIIDSWNPSTFRSFVKNKGFSKPAIWQDNAKLISQPAKKKFATSFLKSGNINLLNDVVMALHSSGYKFDQVINWFPYAK